MLDYKIEFRTLLLTV